MATIRKRNGKWQAQVRRNGSPALSRSFRNKGDAQTWARHLEAEAERYGLPRDLKVLDRLTVSEVLTRYRDTITPAKRGKVRETFALNAFLKHPFASLSLSTLTIGKVAAYRDERLRTLKPASVNRELAIYRHAFEVARKVWDLPLRSNPFCDVAKPKVQNARERRLQPGEWERLDKACRQSRNPFIRDMVEFGLETAMRRGEVLNARWQEVDFEKRTLHIPRAKNGHSRTIPLSPQAIEILHRRAAGSDQVHLFPTTEDAVKMAWRRVMKRARLTDFRYHDLRHEAVSRLFEVGLSLPEVALISGHRDPRLLFRYTHLRPEAIAHKLAALGA